MKKLWFKNKTYGWGWYPASKEGWAVLAVWIALFVLGEIKYLRALKTYEGAAWVTVVFLLWTTLIVAALIYVSYRTGEKPEWRWGNKPAPRDTQPPQTPPQDDAK